jgi:tRNA pseudouridine38-40 synthase
MREAARLMVGEIDCAALANRRNGEVPPVEMTPRETTRVVRDIIIVEEGDSRLRVDFHVKSALYKMVRNMVGLLMYVGAGRAEPADVAALLAARDREKLPQPAPAHGLTLESVYYAVGWDGAYSHPLHTDMLCESPDSGS